MSDLHSTEDTAGWLDASGLPHILRTLSLAVHPAKLGIALAAIILTLALGGALDVVWRSVDTVDAHAIDAFIHARQTGTPYTEPDGDSGIFEVWRAHQRRCVLGLLGSSVPGASLAADTPIGRLIESNAQYQPLRNFASMVDGVIWLLQQHFVFFVIFGVGWLLIWSAGGGAICRIAAVQFARDEKLTMKQALTFAWGRLFGGFFLAPCIPLILAALAMVAIAVSGLVLRIPLIGDVLGGLLFVPALLGGFLAAVLIVGFFVGGSLFWPSVATESSDAFDAFSRGLSYPLSKAWKALWYTIVSLVFAGVCWTVVYLFTYFGLGTTRFVLAFGTSPFGLWSRGDAAHPMSKIELLWPMAGPNVLYTWPNWSQLGWYEYISAGFIGVGVLLVIALLWSFLASFYFSSCTVVYFLLRRDVDGTDLEEVYLAETETAEPHGTDDSAGDDAR